MKKDLLILTAPPASGKTFWIQEFHQELNDPDLLILSPLRALADECKEKWGASPMVMTPEEWMKKKIYPRRIIVDEFHLNFYWGDTFRPLMWEVFFDLAMKCELMVLLTATLNLEMQEELKTFTTEFDEIIWCDLGNQILKNYPARYVRLPDPKIMSSAILHDCSPGVKLIFCQFREEVFHWEKILRENGKIVLSCVGGEAAGFGGKLVETKNLEFIISTTVLSHGVNLPTISKIYFLYPVNNLDFWIQMVARGGRRGESYDVYALENPHGIIWSSWRNHLTVTWLQIKLGIIQFLESWDECFLKESSSVKLSIRSEISS
jgi:superfamily II DNA helicase RecQ